MAGWAALSGRIPKLKGRLRLPPATTILQTTGNVARLALDGIKESADPFPPLKGAAGGIIFGLESRKRLKAAREDWTSLDTRASYLEALDSQSLPPGLQNVHDELMSFLVDIKLKAVDSQRRLHGLFGVINLRKEEEKISFLKAELQNRLDKFEATRKHLHDQLVLKNQLQQLHDQAEQSEQLQLSGNAINRIENQLSDMTLSLQSSIHKELYYMQIELRQLEAHAVNEKLYAIRETNPHPIFHSYGHVKAIRLCPQAPIMLLVLQEAYNSLIGSLDSSERSKRSGTPRI
ncbi:hypothetical protein BU17DRAFT_70521 [Hysterangium stoloniferum]|nr:hypothetical protein BU17DRAFT_70521 [Hysterangium stoloniferum]